MRTISASLLVGALVAQEAAATWNLNAKSYSSPNNSNNQCGDKQKSGFNWDSLSTGKSFSSYGGFDFSGFSCSSKFGKRDDLTRRTFQSKCITGSISKGSSSSSSSSSSGPSFSCSDRGFSIDELQVSVSIDTEVEFHYTMEDNSVCKQTKSCSKSGTTVKNTQCGGAKSVTFKIPDHGSESSCDFGIHSIGFNCDSGYTSTKAISSATPTPSQYSPSSEAVYPTPSSEAVYSSSYSEAVYSSSSEVAYSTPDAVYSTGTPTPTPESTTEQPTPYETAPVESWSFYSESSAVYSTSAESSPAESTPVYSTAVESSTLTEATGVYSTSVESTPVYPTSESTPTPYSSAVESYPVESYPVESYPAESTVVESTAVYSTAIYSTTPVYSPPVESTAVYSSQVESSTLTEATGVYSTPVYSSPAESSSACDAAPTSSLPDVLPRCFNTWLSSSCKDNADYSCYCKDADFAQQIYDCVSAWESDSTLISQALSYFVGLCAEYVPENPGLVSNCPSSVTLGPSYSAPASTAKCTESAPVYSSAVITPAPSSPAVYTSSPVESTAVYVSSSVYLTTITVSQTVTVPCTVPTGVSAGFTIPSSSTLSTYTTTVTVPQVAFTTKTVTLSGTTSETVNIIPGTPAPVSATATSLNGYGTTSTASFGTVTLPKTATATLPAFTGAAGKSAAPYTGAAFAAVMALFAL